jgi:thymidylate kinase
MDEDKRIKERGLNQISRCPSDINQIKFFENQISFYDLFFKKNPENVLIIDGNHSPHLLCQQAIEWIKKLPASISSKTITI